FGQETHEDGRFANRADGLRQSTMGIMRMWALYSPAMTFASALGLGLILWVGGGQVVRGAMTSGELVAFLFYLGLLYEPIRQLHALNQLLEAARAAAARMFDILDFAVERMDNKRRHSFPECVRGEVIYEKVGFQYAADKQVLHDISLHACPGDMVALVG